MRRTWRRNNIFNIWSTLNTTSNTALFVSCILLLSLTGVLVGALLGRFRRGVTGAGVSLLIFSVRPPDDVLTGLELPGARAERQTASSGTDVSSSCSGVECLLTDLRGLLKNAAEEEMSHFTHVSLSMLWMYRGGNGHWILTYRSGEGEAFLLCVTVAGFALVLTDLMFELLLELFLLTGVLRASCCFGVLI